MAGHGLKRLSEATLGRAVDVERPAYDRSTPPTIVHLGVGAFARAHLAVYADDLGRQGRPVTIHGVSLRSPRAEHELAPQDGLFTVTTREPDVRPSTRVVGSMTRISTGVDRAIEAIADPATTLVTLTVTEKAYDHAGAESVPAMLAKALERRHRATEVRLVVASLDNLLDNGAVLGRLVRRAADERSADLAAWISTTVQFPRSVVDRMVPAATAAWRADLTDRLGVVDEGAVVTEAHRSWVIESVSGLPPLAEVGVEVTSDVEPYQRRKLWLLNGPHSALAYLGLLSGHETIAEAAADPVISDFVQGFVEDVLAVVDLDAYGPRAFADESLRRFANPTLGHTCAQVGADGSRKLPQRILPVMVRRRSRGLTSPRLALVVATWLAAITQATVGGTSLPLIDDPAAQALRSGIQRHGPGETLASVLGGVGTDVVAEVVDALGRLASQGARAHHGLA